jgi:hypothetical protein
MIQPRQHPRRLPEATVTGPTGFALGFVASLTAVLAGALASLLFGAPSRLVLTTALLALAVAAVAAVTTIIGAVAVALQAWATYSGFVVHQLGELRLDTTDRPALIVFLALAVGASLLARLPATVHTHPLRPRRSRLVSLRLER